VDPIVAANNAPEVASPIADTALERGTFFELPVDLSFTDVDRDHLTFTIAMADGSALPE
jgi:hypothetical protein